MASKVLTTEYSSTSTTSSIVSKTSTLSLSQSQRSLSLYVFGGLPRYEGKRCEKLSSNGWISMKPMPTSRCYLAAAVVNGKIYVIGGRDAKQEVVSSIECYNPVTGTWSTIFGVKPTYLRSEFGVAVVKEKIFLIGGYAESCTKVECYDVKVNQICQRQDLQRGRWGHGVVECRGRIYACGGQWCKYKESDEKSRRMTSIYLADVESYDPVIDRWQREPSMNRRRGYFGLTVYEDKIYAVGGMGGECNQRRSGRLDSIEKFDTYTGQWTIIETKMEYGSANLTAVIFQSKLFIIGGNRDQEETEARVSEHYRSSSFLSSVQVVDLKNSFSTQVIARTFPFPLPSPRHSFAAVVVDNV